MSATNLLAPRDIIADAIMRSSGAIPSPATSAKTDAALADLADSGWCLVPTEYLDELLEVAERGGYERFAATVRASMRLARGGEGG